MGEWFKPTVLNTVEPKGSLRSNRSASASLHGEKAARASLEARGLPYYGEYRYKFPRHFSSFANMHRRCKDTDFPRTLEGFLKFVEYLGNVPEGMNDPTVGRKDHSLGYLIGNIEWQARAANSKESCIRNESYRNLPRGVSPNGVKHKKLREFIDKTTGIFTSQQLSDLNRGMNKRSILDTVKQSDRCKLIQYKSRENFTVEIKNSI